MLLPTEADLCNSLGLTEEEYFKFLEGVEAKAKERPEAYDLVPDIVNLPSISALPVHSISPLEILIKPPDCEIEATVNFSAASSDFSVPSVIVRAPSNS